MKNKFLIFATLLFIFISSTVFAQEDNNHEIDLNDNHEKMLNKLTTELNLTPDQINKAKSIHLKYKPEIQKLREESRPIREKIRNIREKEKAEFESILNADQKKKLLEIRANFKEKLKERRMRE